MNCHFNNKLAYLGGIVIFAPHIFIKACRSSLRLFRHEYQHVQQYKKYALFNIWPISWPIYWVIYLCQTIGKLGKWRETSFEKEARQAETSEKIVTLADLKFKESGTIVGYLAETPEINNTISMGAREGKVVTIAHNKKDPILFTIKDMTNKITISRNLAELIVVEKTNEC